MERTERPVRADEVTTLRAFLDNHRGTLRMKCSGLSQAQLAQPLTPSDMTLGGMMKHLAVVESSWFEDDFMGRGLMPPYDTVDWDADPDWEWHTAKGDSLAELFALFDEAVRRADAVLDEALAAAGVGLDGLSVVDDWAVAGACSGWWAGRLERPGYGGSHCSPAPGSPLPEVWALCA